MPLMFKRPPVTVMPLRELVGVTLLKMAVRIWLAVALGKTDAYNAAAPVTCGVAIEVPS